LLNFYDIVVACVGSTHVWHHIFKNCQVIHLTFANMDSTKMISKDSILLLNHKNNETWWLRVFNLEVMFSKQINISYKSFMLLQIVVATQWFEIVHGYVFLDYMFYCHLHKIIINIFKFYGVFIWFYMELIYNLYIHENYAIQLWVLRGTC
jgi:hypothetical protein